MAPPEKKTSSNTSLWIVLGLVAAVLILAIGAFIFVRCNSDTPTEQIVNGTAASLQEEPTASSSSTSSTTKLTTTTSTSTTTSATTTPVSTTSSTTTLATTTSPSTEPTSSSTVTSTSTPATTVPPPTTTEEVVEELSLPVDTDSIIARAQENRQTVDACLALSVASTTCYPTNEQVTPQSISAISPLHYSLNLTVRSAAPAILHGQEVIVVKVNEDLKQLTLNVGPALRDVTDVNVVACETGTAICVSQSVVDPQHETLTLVFSEVTPANSHIRLSFKNFTAADTKDAVIAQMPNRWVPRSYMGTLKTKNAVRKLFPSFDTPAYRSTYEVCITQRDSSSISNANVRDVSGETTCFERSVPLDTTQFAFVNFNKGEVTVQNKTTADHIYIPATEIVFSKPFEPAKHSFIHDEIASVIALLKTWTGMSYPLEKISIVSAQLPPKTEGQSQLGVITIHERLIEYVTRKTEAKLNLLSQLVRQWFGGIVGYYDASVPCFMDSLSMYLEWRFNEKLHIVNQTTESQVQKARGNNLTTNGQRDARGNVPKCDERCASIFYTLDETFGKNTVSNMIKSVMRSNAFTTTNFEQWQKALVETTNAQAGEMLGEWFKRPNERPIVFVGVSSRAVNLQQLTDNAWTLALEIAGSNGVQLATVTEKNMAVPYASHDYVVVDPKRKSPAVIVYDADTYVRLIRCWVDARCPASQSGLRAVFKDFAAVLLANKFNAPATTDIPKWTSLLKFLRTERLVSDDEMCCVNHGLRVQDNYCTWVIQDKCPKNNLLDAMRAA